MAVQSTLNNRYINPTDAKAAAKSSYESGKIGTTSRGTAIVEKNSGMGKDAFLKLLVAQMSNMDPTQDQDPTAYVTQMSQFASVEQLNNLNTTMQDFAYEQMVGKVAILSDKDTDGYNKYGIITQIIKNGTTTTARILDTTTGLTDDYPMNKIIGTSDSGYGSANYETALNSNFSAASTLAKDNATGVYVEEKKDTKDKVENGQNTTVTTITRTAHKCTIEKAYLDKKNSLVKVTIKLEDGTTKTVDYSTIAVAGKDLSDDVVEQAIKDNTLEPVVSQNTNTSTTDNSVNQNNNTNTNDEHKTSTDNVNSTDYTQSLINNEAKFLANLSK